MSLLQNQREELFTADKELPDFLPADDLMMVFSREIYPAFKDEDFAQYYSSKGRWATSPAFLACVTILQFRENLSDPEAAEACVRRLDWKIALHLPVTEKTSFHPSTLCYYRRRLKENKAMSFILDKTVKLAQQKGFIQKRTNQRVDATHIICHVNRICTTDLLFRTVKCVVEEIKKKDLHYYHQELPQYIRERYSQRFSSFGMSRNSRMEKLSEIVEDGLLIKTLLERIPSSSLSGSEQLPIMETVFLENVVIKKKEIEGKIFVEAEEIQSPRQTIFDPRDRSIRLGKKANKSWVGSKCHVVETAQKRKVNFITNMIYQQAHEYDAYVHKELREGNERRDLRPEKVYADMGYINGSAICEYRKHGQELMGYMQAESSKKPEAFKIQRFLIDMERKKALCPAGKESLKAQIGKEGEIKMPFSKSACPVCDYFRECVGERKGKMRLLTVRPWYEFVRERREIQETKTFRDEMKVRAQVEGTISESTRFLGLRRAKYKGEDGHRIQFYMTGVALNFKRLAKAVTQGIEIQRKPLPAFAN